MSAAELAVNVIIVSAGSMVLMWIGELISEFGIGNGVSLIIFAGIVAGLPSTIGQLWFTANPITDPSLIPLYVGFVIAAIAIMLGVVTVTEAERPVPITYAKKVRGTKTYGGVSTYLPIRVNQAGVIPIIFALSLLIFPQVIVNFMSFVDNETIQRVSIAIQDFLANTVATSVIYFFLVFAFTFFYTAVTFDPDAIATNLQKSGAFVPGVRPGHSTSEYLAKVLSRITFIGATFLSVVAVLPFAMIALTGVQGLAIGGTALLIVVSVVLDLVKKIDAQLSMREY
jgi:preprotein translocase subunit SecY